MISKITKGLSDFPRLRERLARISTLMARVKLTSHFRVSSYSAEWKVSRPFRHGYKYASGEKTGSDSGDSTYGK